MTIAKFKSFTGAAAKLSIAQPTLSVKIIRLEHELGFSLFYRSKRSAVELTSDGEKFAVEAQKLIVAYENAISCGRNILHSKNSSLRFGAESFSLHIPERNAIVYDFMRLNPSTIFSVKNEPPAQLFDQLKNSELDVIFCTLPSDFSSMDVLRICEYRLSLLIPIEKACQNNKLIDLNMLRGSKIFNVRNGYHIDQTSRIRLFFEPYDIEIISPPEEGYEAVVRFAQMLRVPMITLDLPPRFHEIPGDMALSGFQNASLPIEWYLIKRMSSESKPLDKLWELGSKFSTAAL